MKYKVIALESDYEEVETGTCELCMGTDYIDCGSIILEDENGQKVDIPLSIYCGWGMYDELYIDNVVNFSAWLAQQDIKPLIDGDFGRLETLINQYNMEKTNEIQSNCC